MPTVALYNMKAEKVGEIELADAVFGIEPNTAVMHRAVVTYLNNQRQGTQSTLTRAEVSGGGIKPWRQKGTGRARQGSTRSPQWTHGGIAFGPKPRDYTTGMNKKARRLALFSALSDKVANGKLIVVDAVTAQEYKTSVMADMLKAFNAEGKTVITLAEADEKVIFSARNIAGVSTVPAVDLNTYTVLNNDQIIITRDAVEKLQEVYA